MYSSKFRNKVHLQWWFFYIFSYGLWYFNSLIWILQLRVYQDVIFEINSIFSMTQVKILLIKVIRFHRRLLFYWASMKTLIFYSSILYSIDYRKEFNEKDIISNWFFLVWFHSLQCYNYNWTYFINDNIVNILTILNWTNNIVIEMSLKE